MKPHLLLNLLYIQSEHHVNYPFAHTHYLCLALCVCNEVVLRLWTVFVEWGVACTPHGFGSSFWRTGAGLRLTANWTTRNSKGSLWKRSGRASSHRDNLDWIRRQTRKLQSTVEPQHKAEKCFIIQSSCLHCALHFHLNFIFTLFHYLLSLPWD